MGRRGQGYGSEDHLRRLLDRGELTEKVAKPLGVSAEAISWLARPGPDGEGGEFQGLGFLPPEERVARAAWRGFWPTRGRQQSWDAVGRADDAWVLVEAKANAPEFCSPPTTATGVGRAKIERTLNRVKRDLGVHRFFTWTGSFYQYANRLAILWFLRDHGIDARLLFVYFYGDRFPDGTPCPQTPDEWERLIEARRLTLGLPESHQLSPFEYHVYLAVPRRS